MFRFLAPLPPFASPVQALLSVGACIHACRVLEPFAGNNPDHAKLLRYVFLLCSIYNIACMPLTVAFSPDDRQMTFTSLDV